MWKWRKRNDELLGEDGKLSIKSMRSEIRETSGLFPGDQQGNNQEKRAEVGNVLLLRGGQGGEDNKGL